MSLSTDLMTQLAVNPHVLETLGWDSVKKLLDDRVLSVPGKSLAAKIRPLPIDDAKRSLSLTSELKNAMIEGASPEVAGLAFCAAPARRASKGSVMSQSEILAVRSTLICSTRMVDFFSSRETTMPGCFAESSALPDIRALASQLKRSFTDDGDIKVSHSKHLPLVGRKLATVTFGRQQFLYFCGISRFHKNHPPLAIGVLIDQFGVVGHRGMDLYNFATDRHIQTGY